MEPMPVGKRTRLQRAIQEKKIRDRNKQARSEARMKHKKNIEHVISSDDNDEEEDDNEEDAKVVDEEEYNRITTSRVIVHCTSGGAAAATITTSTCPQSVDELNMACTTGDRYGLGQGYVMKENGWPTFCNVANGDGGGGGGGGGDSDDSLQIIGERWNPMIFGDYDDIDDDSDEEDVVIHFPVSGGGSDSGEEGSQCKDDVGLISSEDDDNLKDKDFSVDGWGNYSTSDYSSSFDEEGNSSDEGYKGGRVKERKKSRDREREGGDKERHKGRGRKKKERVYEEKVRVGGDHERTRENKEGKRGRKKKVKISKEEVFESLVSSMNPKSNAQNDDDDDDNVCNVSGEKKSDSDSRRSVKLKKGSDGVFRKVVSSDENVERERKPNSDTRSSSVKLKKGSDGVFRKVSSHEDDDNVDRPTKPKSDPRASSVKLKKGSDGVFRKIDSVCEDEDDGVPNKPGPNRSVKFKKQNDGVLKKVESTDEDEKPKKKVVRKERDEEEGGDEDVSLERESSAQALSKRKRKEKLTEVLETILEEVDNGAVEESMLLLTTSLRDHSYLPLKFHFPAKEAEPEKTEDELELENLFKELEFGLQTCYIASDDSSVLGDDMEVDAPKSAVSENMLCAGGRHHLIPDEEIGVYCRFCSYVMLESKHVTPDFDNEIFGSAGRRESKKLQSEDKKGEIQILDCIENGEGNPEPSKIIQGTVWELIPGTWRTLYPHQREGFEFIWRNVAGGINIEELDRPSKYGIGGCIICHAPGTGKTRLAIVFIQSFLNQYPMSKPVIVAPRTMLRTWQEEFVRWKIEVPFHNLNEGELSGKEDSDVLRQVEAGKSWKNIRAAKLSTWVKGKGILGISYGLYEKLANEKNNGDKRIRDILLNRPGLLVLDEGHTPRNEKSNIWRVLSDVLTKRKVILSGTPFQNNFDELSNTLSLVREEFEVPMKAGSYIHDERKIEELSNKIRPFVHVHKGEILKETLKGLFSSLIILKPSEQQKRCFAAIVGQANFALDNLVSVASVHPSIFCEQKPSFIDKEWMASLESRKHDLDAGVKTRFLVELIQLSQGERVLVFGQFLPPLKFLAGLLKSRFRWEMGRELLYMNGRQDTKERQNTIRFFNDPKSEARVLLASTKACCEGIHLVGASRVVLLDVVWNPSVERQAISRAYRLGQKKDVFVYHLITSGTIEEQKYKRQATKERLSELVFSSSDGKCIQKPSTGSQIFVDKVLEAMLEHEKMKSMFHKIVYQPKADNLIDTFGPLNL
ncbi:hypothetical protein vseg_016707 [Gypsophila vaccaria]